MASSLSWLLLSVLELSLEPLAASLIDTVVWSVVLLLTPKLGGSYLVDLLLRFFLEDEDAMEEVNLELPFWEEESVV